MIVKLGKTWYIEFRTDGPGRDIKGPFYSDEEAKKALDHYTKERK